MTRHVTAHEAKITTATVDIKTIRVGAKQMTQSVFRQLPQECIVDVETMQLKGAPWGTVNYFWKGCGLKYRHLHVIWQKGNELRRSCITHDPSNQPEFDGIGNWFMYDEEVPHSIAVKWKQLYEQLAALDQLFIAV